MSDESAAVADVAWFHSFDFGAAGHKSVAALRAEAQHLPDVRGKSVLDVNCWDGWFSFECERRGASRVVALDRYVWATDLVGFKRYREAMIAAGRTPPPAEQSPYWHPETLPGKAGFDTAKRLLGSKAEPVVGDLATMDEESLSRLGTFDVVLWLGSLYHMRDPQTALERIRRVTAPGGVAVIETEAVVVPGQDHVPLCVAHGPTNPLNNDPTNRWSPNERAIHQLCRVSGFSHVTTVAGPPPRGRREALRSALPGPLKGLVPPRETSVRHYRAWVHARR